MLPSLDLNSELLGRKVSQRQIPAFGKFVFVREQLGISCKGKWMRQQQDLHEGYRKARQKRAQKLTCLEVIEDSVSDQDLVR